jgi:hypothetical protein
MDQHWLDIQSFLTDQRLLGAIDDLAIATKFNLAGVHDPERADLAEAARTELRRFLVKLGELTPKESGEVVKGVDPRLKELVDTYEAARLDRDNFPSPLMRLGTEALLRLLSTRSRAEQQELLSCLADLRRVVERHQQVDFSAILEEI